MTPIETAREVAANITRSDKGWQNRVMNGHHDELPQVQAALAMHTRLSDDHAAAVKELVEGLQWYADNTALCRLIHSGGDAGRNALAADGGKRAQALIAKHRPEAFDKAEGLIDGGGGD